LLHALVHPADIQDRDGGVLVLKTLFGRYPFLKKLFADGGYQGPVFAKGQKKAMPGLATEIVKRSDAAKGFGFCRDDGWSNGRSRGWGDAVGWPRTSRTCRATRSHSSNSPLFASCCEGSVQIE